MIYKKRLFSACVCQLFFSALFCEDTSFIYRILDARLKTRLCASSQDAISAMDALRNQLENEGLFNQPYTETAMIADNMISLERYNYMYEKNANDAELRPFITSQYEKLSAWQEKNQKNGNAEGFSPWFFLSAGDVINSSMQFLSQSQAIKLGLQEKSDYDRVVEKNPRLAFARINRGLWYYFAPAIGGGSKKIALSDFSYAVECAACDYERFYARIYLSQMLYEDGKKADCEGLLAECDEILKGNIYTDFIRRLNEGGYSLLYYTNNREKVEKKLGL